MCESPQARKFPATPECSMPDSLDDMERIFVLSVLYASILKGSHGLNPNYAIEFPKKYSKLLHNPGSIQLNARIDSAACFPEMTAPSIEAALR